MRFLRLSAMLFAVLLGLPAQVAGQLRPLSEAFPLWMPTTVPGDPDRGPYTYGIPGFPVAIALPHGFVLASMISDSEDNQAIQAESIDLSGLLGPMLLNGSEWGTSELDPAVAATSPGGLVLASVEEASDSDDNELYLVLLRRFALGGVLSGAPVPLTEAVDSGFCSPAVAGNASGGFVVAWEGECFFSVSPLTLSARAFDSSGEPATAELAIPMPETSRVSGRPRVGIDAAGRFVVLWRQAGATDAVPAKLCGQAYGAKGGFLGSRFCIGELAGSTVGALAIDPAGSFLAAWFGPAAPGAQTPLFVCRYQMNGTPLGSPVQVAAANPSSGLSASSDRRGNAALSWQEGNQMRVLLVRRDAVAKGPAITISGVKSDPDVYANGVALNDFGRLLVTWLSGDRIFGRLWQARF